MRTARAAGDVHSSTGPDLSQGPALSGVLGGTPVTARTPITVDHGVKTEMNKREPVMAPGVMEILRLCVVVFSGGVGFTVARSAAADSDLRVGPFDATSVGLILGGAVGYVLGGILARLTSRSLREV